MEMLSIETWTDSAGSYASCVIGDCEYMIECEYPETMNVFLFRDHDYCADNLIDYVHIKDMDLCQLRVYMKLICKSIENEYRIETVRHLNNCLDNAVKAIGGML